MKTSVYSILVLCFILLPGCSSNEKDKLPQRTEIYFPPINSDTWDTIAPSEIGWNDNQLQSLLDYLEEKNTKGFVMLHNGKIVVEAYMNDHDKDTYWYWASAGKTLTTAVCGIAQEEGILDINAKVSDYLGTGWTNTALEKENQITCKNLLSMNSGLDDTLGDDVSPSNLQYIADAGTRWAYHNVYVKMQDVVSTVSNLSWNNYFNEKLKNKIGMNGAWISLGGLSLYSSNTRSMARFGLMMYAHGKWENTQIVQEEFLHEATNTSQNINQAYGYLWWLNGKSSYHLPQSQFEFIGELISNAPSDMYAALGKNEQKIYVVPSKKLVVIRMGEAANPENPTFGLSGFDNELWLKINALTD